MVRSQLMVLPFSGDNNTATGISMLHRLQSQSPPRRGGGGGRSRTRAAIVTVLQLLAFALSLFLIVGSCLHSRRPAAQSPLLAHHCPGNTCRKMYTIAALTQPKCAAPLSTSSSGGVIACTPHFLDHYDHTRRIPPCAAPIAPIPPATAGAASSLFTGRIVIRFAAAAPSSAPGDIILGVCRVPYLDQLERLTGLMVAIDDANRNGWAPDGRRVRAEVHYYPFCSNGACDFSDGKREEGLAAFVGNMSRFHAVLFPHFNISSVIIDAAAAMGLPVIDPNTIRESDYSLPNIFLMEQTIETELSVVIRFMLMAHSCARTGIVHEGQPRYAALVAEAFAFGGYEATRTLSWPHEADRARDFFFGDPHQKCVFLLMTSVGFMNFMGSVYEDSRFVPGAVKLFSWSQTSTSVMRVGNTSAPFTNFFFPKVIPPTYSDIRLVSDYRAAVGRWFASPQQAVDVAEHYRAGEVVANNATTASGLMWYFRAVYAIKLAAHAVTGLPMPPPAGVENTSLVWERMLFAATETKIWASDFPFFLPIRGCPPKPLPQVCSCNVVTRTLYMLGVEGVGGTPYFVTERPLLGETNVANVALAPDRCVFKSLSVSSYPFRVLTLDDVGVSSAAEDTKAAGKTPLERVLYKMVSTQNFADPAPIRPWRIATEGYPLPSNSSSTSFAAEAAAADLETARAHVEEYRPFFLLGSARPIAGDAGVLSAFTTSALGMRLADPPLAPKAGRRLSSTDSDGGGDDASSGADGLSGGRAFSPSAAAAAVASDATVDAPPSAAAFYAGPHGPSERSEWTPNTIFLEPVLADYVHALVDYFAHQQTHEDEEDSDNTAGGRQGGNASSSSGAGGTDDNDVHTSDGEFATAPHFSLPFSGLYVLAASAAEMAIAVASLHSHQVFTAADIDPANPPGAGSLRATATVVSGDASEWRRLINRWGTVSASSAPPLPVGNSANLRRPFILAVTSARPDLAAAALAAVREVKSAVVGLATADLWLHDAWVSAPGGLYAYSHNKSASSSAPPFPFPRSALEEGGDLLFASPFSEYWADDDSGDANGAGAGGGGTNPFRQYLAQMGVVDAVREIATQNNNTSTNTVVSAAELLSKLDPRVLVKVIGMGLAHQLSLQAALSLKGAAEVLFTARTASVGDIALGPFSNETCDHATIVRGSGGSGSRSPNLGGSVPLSGGASTAAGSGGVPISTALLFANSGAADRACQCNKGLRQFRIHSMYNKLRRERSLRTNRHAYTMATCGVKYLPLVPPPPLPPASMLGTVLAAALSAGLGLLAFVLTAAVSYVCCFSGRNNRAAPKDSSVPFAIVFTDIQSSTTLWSRCPAVMSDAVEQHCSIIRALISQHNGYEVKTIGDSFMVAFKKAESAVRFALRVQERLYEAEWPAELDQQYREVIEAAALERHHQRLLMGEEGEGGGGSSAAGNGNVGIGDASNSPLNGFANNESGAMLASGYATSAAGGFVGATTADNFTFAMNNIDFLQCPNAPADDAVYRQQWNGIRVRIGVNYGMGECRKDAVTLGYDYFGTLVNTAARVEGVGHGGQTLVTDAVLRELPHGFVRTSTAAPNNTVMSNTIAASDGASSKPPYAPSVSLPTVAISVSHQRQQQKAASSSTAAVALLLELGPQALRGLDDRVILHQLLPLNPAAARSAAPSSAPTTSPQLFFGGLAGRRFPPLRLEVENIVAEGTDDDDESGADSADGGDSAYLYEWEEGTAHTPTPSCGATATAEGGGGGGGGGGVGRTSSHASRNPSERRSRGEGDPLQAGGGAVASSLSPRSQKQQQQKGRGGGGRRVPPKPAVVIERYALRLVNQFIFKGEAAAANGSGRGSAAGGGGGGGAAANGGSVFLQQQQQQMGRPTSFPANNSGVGNTSSGKHKNSAAYFHPIAGIGGVGVGALTAAGKHTPLVLSESALNSNALLSPPQQRKEVPPYHYQQQQQQQQQPIAVLGAPAGGDAAVLLLQQQTQASSSAAFGALAAGAGTNSASLNAIQLQGAASRMPSFMPHDDGRTNNNNNNEQPPPTQTSTATGVTATTDAANTTTATTTTAPCGGGGDNVTHRNDVSVALAVGAEASLRDGPPPLVVHVGGGEEGHRPFCGVSSFGVGGIAVSSGPSSQQQSSSLNALAAEAVAMHRRGGGGGLGVGIGGPTAEAGVDDGGESDGPLAVGASSRRRSEERTRLVAAAIDGRAGNRSPSSNSASFAASPPIGRAHRVLSTNSSRSAAAAANCISAAVGGVVGGTEFFFSRAASDSSGRNVSRPYVHSSSGANANIAAAFIVGSGDTNTPLHPNAAGTNNRASPYLGMGYTANTSTINNNNNNNNGPYAALQSGIHSSAAAAAAAAYPPTTASVVLTATNNLLGGGGGTASNTPSATSAKEAAVAELTAYYHFLATLLSTSAEPYRREALRHFGKRWRIPHPTRVGLGGLLNTTNAKLQQQRQRKNGNDSSLLPPPPPPLPDGNNLERMKCLMHVAVKAMVAARGQRARNAAAMGSGIGIGGVGGSLQVPPVAGGGGGSRAGSNALLAGGLLSGGGGGGTSSSQRLPPRASSNALNANGSRLNSFRRRSGGGDAADGEGEEEMQLVVPSGAAPPLYGFTNVNSNTTQTLLSPAQQFDVSLLSSRPPHLTSPRKSLPHYCPTCGGGGAGGGGGGGGSAFAAAARPLQEQQQCPTCGGDPSAYSPSSTPTALLTDLHNGYGNSSGSAGSPLGPAVQQFLSRLSHSQGQGQGAPQPLVSNTSISNQVMSIAHNPSFGPSLLGGGGGGGPSAAAAALLALQSASYQASVGNHNNNSSSNGAAPPFHDQQLPHYAACEGVSGASFAGGVGGVAGASGGGFIGLQQQRQRGMSSSLGAGAAGGGGASSFHTIVPFSPPAAHSATTTAGTGGNYQQQQHFAAGPTSPIVAPRPSHSVQRVGGNGDTPLHAAHIMEAAADGFASLPLSLPRAQQLRSTAPLISRSPPRGSYEGGGGIGQSIDDGATDKMFANSGRLARLAAAAAAASPANASPAAATAGVSPRQQQSSQAAAPPSPRIAASLVRLRGGSGVFVGPSGAPQQ